MDKFGSLQSRPTIDAYCMCHVSSASLYSVVLGAIPQFYQIFDFDIMRWHHLAVQIRDKLECGCTTTNSPRPTYQSHFELQRVLDEVTFTDYAGQCRYASENYLFCGIQQQHTHTTVLRPFVRDYPGEPVPEETSIHSHPSCSTTILVVFLHLP